MHSNNNTYDVVILGGGPAGASAGLTLLKRAGTRVAMIESSKYDGFRIGESLSPGVRPMLEYLGLWERFSRSQPMDSFGSKAAWGSPEMACLDYLFTIHGSGWNLDRAEFDGLLADVFAERGGDFWSGFRFVSVERQDNGWSMVIRGEDGAETELRAGYLIDATGRKGVLARALDAGRFVYDHLVGVGQVGKLPEGATLDSFVQVEACEYGWWYSAPVPGGNVSTVLMSDADIVSRLGAGATDVWQELLAAMPHTGTRVADVEFTGQPTIHAAFSACLEACAGDGWAAVGDAVASHDPLSSSGIPHAMGSGTQGAILAANCLFGDGKNDPERQQAGQDRYRNAVSADFRQYMKTRWQYYRQEDRWAEATFWKRRRSQISIDPCHRVARNMNSEEVEPVISNDAVHLPKHKMAQLWELTEAEMEAQEVVRAFKQLHPQIPDEKIILALQELLAAGALELNAAHG